MNKLYNDGVDINRPTISLFPILDKINTMEGVAEFLQSHPRTIRKYANQIIDKIRSIKPDGLVHLNALRTLVRTEQEYYNTNIYEDSVDFREAVIRVFCAYSESILTTYVPGLHMVLYDTNGKYDKNCRSDYSVTQLFDKSYLPAMLLCSNPATVDRFIERCPVAKEYLFEFVIDRHFSYRKPEDRELVKNFFISNYPTISSFSSIDKDYFAVRNLKKKLIDEMNITDAEKIDLSKLPIEDCMSALARVYGGNFLNHEDIVGNLDQAECHFNYLQRHSVIAKFEKYFGDDAGLLFDEVISIFYNWFWEKHRFGDWMERLVIEERKFIDYISEEYAVDKSAGKLLASNALDWIDSHDITEEEVSRVKTLINSNEKVSENANSKPVEPTFYKWKKDKSDFEQLALEEEDDYLVEEATEGRTRRKSNIKRTANLERAKSKAYGIAKDISDGTEKINQSITGLMNSMKKLFVGDLRSEIIEGKQMTFMTLFKSLIGICFATQLGPVKGACALLIRYVAKRKMTTRERNQIIHELDSEIAIITEKIADADRDGNRKAKYNMMRTKAELERARNRIRNRLGNAPSKSATVKSSLSEGGY